MRTVLAAVCALTLLATAALTLSVLVLQPPRVNYQVWFALAAFIALQGGMTLFGLFGGGFDRGIGAGAPYMVIAGGAALVAIGAWMLRDTLTGAHFEGYALVLGSLLFVQGVLTAAVFGRPWACPPKREARRWGVRRV